MHELLNRLGVNHEQVHPESRKYLKTLPAYVPYAKSNPGHVDDLRFPGGEGSGDGKKFYDNYDIASIMHYKLQFFEVLDKAGLEKLVKDRYGTLFSINDIGQDECLFKGDAKFLHFLANELVPNLSCDKFGVADAQNNCKPIKPPE
jgi:hypothetical protein